mmetsp:Transcript_79154/g.226960  ORF Transcript_79154/g.226960 Transcript_79154/m.226960 type:complete len:200 (+) Transcript_79154:526-1125(+)
MEPLPPPAGAADLPFVAVSWRWAYAFAMICWIFSYAKFWHGNLAACLPSCATSRTAWATLRRCRRRADFKASCTRCSCSETALGSPLSSSPASPSTPMRATSSTSAALNKLKRWSLHSVATRLAASTESRRPAPAPARKLCRRRALASPMASASLGCCSAEDLRRRCSGMQSPKRPKTCPRREDISSGEGTGEVSPGSN